jgi:uncharacterized protein (DUF1697 family)
MKTFISLLRGINVSGQNRIRMPELKELYESLNLVNVMTYIQSGNVVFDCEEQEPAKLARIIEAEIARSFSLSVRVLLRDKDRFQEILSSNPFVNQRNEDPERLHVTFLSEAPTVLALRDFPASVGDCFVAQNAPRNDIMKRRNGFSTKDDGGSNNWKESGAGNEDEFLVYDREIYLFCPNGYGRTKLSNSFFERKLGVAATTRNWKTVNALYEMASQR